MSNAVLMCPPRYFLVSYEINPWMNTSNQVNSDLAYAEWRQLTDVYKRLGVYVNVLQPKKNLPDLVFTANAGLIYRHCFFPSNFRFPERQPEKKCFVDWFHSRKYRIIELPETLIFEGAGDALFCGDKLFLGHGFRSSKEAVGFFSKYLPDIKIISLGLSNPYFYHLDTCLSPLPGGNFIYYPDAFDDESRLVLKKMKGYEISEELCVNYGCNLGVIGNTVVTSFCDTSLKGVCKKLGLNLVTVKMGEFMKSGGGVRCLTLFLD